MENVIKDNILGGTLQDNFIELLLPETLFAPEDLQGSNAPKMYKEVRDLIYSRGGEIEKRKGLPIKKALEAYCSDPQAVQDAKDLAREFVEAGIRTLSSRRVELAKSHEPSGSQLSNRSGPAAILDELTYIPHAGGVPGQIEENTKVGNPQDERGRCQFPTSMRNQFGEPGQGAENRNHGPYRQGNLGRTGAIGRHGSGPQCTPPFPDPNVFSQRQTPGPEAISTHAVNVLSKLATRFKDRADKFGGDDGENWEDVYSTYLNCASQWRVPEHAALRNIEIILAGEAKTYSKRKVQANPNAFSCCEQVNQFILKTFHGLEAQEAT